jgi:hypothetical protein
VAVIRPVVVAPPGDPGDLSRKAPQVSVFVGGVLFEQRFQVLSCSRYVGGQPRDTATIELRDITSEDGSRINPIIKHTWPNSEIAIEVDIPTRQQLHYGRVVNTQTRVSPAGEIIIIHSRLDDHLFGQPLDTIKVGTAERDSKDYSDIVQDVDAPLVFNPKWEGQSTPNMTEGPAARTDAGYVSAFVDPRSVPVEDLNEDRRRNDSWTGQRPVSVEYWTLWNAVQYLCRTLNEGQRWIRNPTGSELIDALSFVDDDKVLRDVRIPKGTYLPEALDMLLRPHGFGWTVDLIDRRTRKICVFEYRSVSPPLSLPYMKHGEDLKVEEQAVSAFDLSLDFARDSFNQIEVLGEQYERELSVILRPAWDPSHDAQADDSYFDKEGANWSEAGVQDAWRRFALNEAGDYDDFSREWWGNESPLHLILANPDGTTTPDDPDEGEEPDPTPDDPDVDDGEEDTTESVSFAYRRRRRMFPAITQNKDGSAYGKDGGIYLEYWEPDDSAGTWKPVKDLFNFQVLKDEAGILITDTRVPQLLRRIYWKHQITNVALRATATFKADRRVRATAKQNRSLVQTPRKVVLEAPGYQYRKIETTLPVADLDASKSIGGSVLTSLTAVTDDGEGDTRSAALKLAVQLLRRFNTGLMEGFIEINGVDWDISKFLGARLHKMSGRDLVLNVAANGLKPKHPTVVGIEYDIPRQITRIRLETLRNTGGIRVHV